MTELPSIPAKSTATAVERGTCALCGQEMARATEDGGVVDVWHPSGVEQACPPEPETSNVPFDVGAWNVWYAAGNKIGRPGFEHFRPLNEETPMPTPPAERATYDALTGAILSVIDPHLTLLCDLDHVYALLEFLLDRPIATHQLPAAQDAVIEHVRAEHPDLAVLDLAPIRHMLTDAPDAVHRAIVEAWLAGVTAATGGAVRRVSRPWPVPTPDLDRETLEWLARQAEHL